MPGKWFRCPDQELVEIEECKIQCRMAERCMTIPTAIMIGYNRPPPKVPHVSASQGGSGVRMLFLRLTTPYVIDPQSTVPALLGTAVHHKLEKGASGDRFVSEAYFRNDYTAAIIDLYERPTRTLYDYKTWGAFAIRKAMGLEKAIVPDPSGAVYKRDCKSGKKGDPKMVEVWSVNPEKKNMRDVELQLNISRILIQGQYPVDKMIVQAIAKEPPWFLKQHGIDRPLYIFDVAFLPDEEVIEVYKTKTEALRHAFRTGEVPDFCSPSERWDGNRCERFCDVAEACDPPWLKKDEVKSVIDEIIW